MTGLLRIQYQSYMTGLFCLQYQSYMTGLLRIQYQSYITGLLRIQYKSYMTGLLRIQCIPIIYDRPTVFTIPIMYDRPTAYTMHTNHTRPTYCVYIQYQSYMTGLLFRRVIVFLSKFLAFQRKMYVSSGVVDQKAVTRIKLFFFCRSFLAPEPPFFGAAPEDKILYF